jgi:hypothetical protein
MSVALDEGLRVASAVLWVGFLLKRRTQTKEQTYLSRNAVSLICCPLLEVRTYDARPTPAENLTANTANRKTLFMLSVNIWSRSSSLALTKGLKALMSSGSTEMEIASMKDSASVKSTRMKRR